MTFEHAAATRYRVRVAFDYGETLSGRVERCGGTWILRARRDDTALLSVQDRIVAVRRGGHRWVTP